MKNRLCLQGFSFFVDFRDNDIVASYEISKIVKHLCISQTVFYVFFVYCTKLDLLIPKKMNYRNSLS